VVQGTIRRAQQVAWCRADGTIEKAKVTELYVTDALDRVEAEEAGPGEIIAVAGIPEVTIGETLADPDDPRPLPVITVDEPSLSMTVGINTSPLAGREGDKVTASQVEARLRAELVGNVSLRVEPTERPDTWEVQGRGELQLEVLVEQMRREGFELTIGSRRSSRVSSTARCTSRSSACPSMCRRSTSASSRSSSRSGRAVRRRSSTTAPGGCGWRCSSRRAA
jgi:GTP-binding protein